MTHNNDEAMIGDFLEWYTRLEEKYGANFRGLTGLEKKNLVAYAKRVGIDQLDDNLYTMREHFSGTDS